MTTIKTLLAATNGFRTAITNDASAYFFSLPRLRQLQKAPVVLPLPIHWRPTHVLGADGKTNTNLSSPQFGQITSTKGSARQMLLL